MKVLLWTIVLLTRLFCISVLFKLLSGMPQVIIKWADWGESWVIVCKEFLPSYISLLLYYQVLWLWTCWVRSKDQFVIQSSIHLSVAINSRQWKKSVRTRWTCSSSSLVCSPSLWKFAVQGLLSRIVIFAIFFGFWWRDFWFLSSGFLSTFLSPRRLCCLQL